MREIGNTVLLKRFSVSNSYCFKDEVILDMTAKHNDNQHETKGQDDLNFDVSEMSKAVFDCHPNEGILPLAAIYGKNASGKTKLLYSLKDAIDDVLGSSFSEQASRFGRSSFQLEVERRRFAILSEGARNKTINYSFCLSMGSKEYTLKYALGFDGVEQENLSCIDFDEINPQTKTIYDRTLGKINVEYSPDSDMTDKMSIVRGRDEKRLWFSLFVPTEEHLRPLHEWFREAKKGMVLSEPDSIDGFQDLARYLMNANKDSQVKSEREAWNFKETLLNSLKYIDDSISQVGAKSHIEGANLWIYHYRPSVENGEKPIAPRIQHESRGTRALIGLFSDIYHSIRYGLPLIVDEIDGSLHPVTFMSVVHMFNNPSINKKGAQLIFTAHDTIILDTTILRRDEIHVVSKGRDSVSSINKLSSMNNVHRHSNLEYEYRTNVYDLYAGAKTKRKFFVLAGDK